MVVLHEHDTFGDKFVNVDASRVVAEGELSGGFVKNIGDTDEQTRVDCSIGSLLDTTEDFICSVNDGLELTAIFEIEISVFWDVLDWMPLEEWEIQGQAPLNSRSSARDFFFISWRSCWSCVGS